jgi:hypothetical protein
MRVRVLLVEPSADDRDMYAEYLQSRGFLGSDLRHCGGQQLIVPHRPT